MYTSTKVTVCDDQYDKLKNAIAHQRPIPIKLYLDHSGGGGGGGGEHTLLLTRGQIAKIDRSRLIGKRDPAQQKTSESKRTTSRRFLGNAWRIGHKSSSIGTRRTHDRAGIKCCETSGGR